MQLLTTYRGLSGIVTDLAWSPDGKRLVTATFSNGPNDQVVHIWEADTRHLLFTYNGPSLPPPELEIFHIYSKHLVWSPDGTRLASASNDRTVQVWEAISGRLLLTYSGHAQRDIIEDWAYPTVWSLAWSPDGSHLISGFDREELIQVWETSSGECVATYPGAILKGGTAWSSDGPRFMLRDLETVVRVWQV